MLSGSAEETSRSNQLRAILEERKRPLEDAKHELSGSFTDNQDESDLAFYLMQYGDPEFDQGNQSQHENSNEHVQAKREQDFLLPEVPARPASAPSRPRSEAEKFRLTLSFGVLERTAVAATQLIQGLDQRFDLESKEGKRAARRFLRHLEELCKALEVSCNSRKYRTRFSQAYKKLYKEDALCYLVEILDSAQEGFPHLWVNGEKYTFASLVIRSGEDLFARFCRIKQSVRGAYVQLSSSDPDINVKRIISRLKHKLTDFDFHWVTFEQVIIGASLDLRERANADRETG